MAYTSVTDEDEASANKYREKSTYNPGVGEGNHVIDIKISSVGVFLIIIGADPIARCGVARRIGFNVGAVSFQDVLTVGELVSLGFNGLEKSLMR